MPEPVSRAARKHIRRAAPSGSAPSPSSPSSPTPAPPAPPPPPPPLLWSQLAEVLKGTADPIYKALGAEGPDLAGWAAFAEAWGAVADYYMPVFANTPLPKAIMATLIVAAPLVAVWQQKQAKKAPPAPKPEPEPANMGDLDEAERLRRGFRQEAA